MSRREGSRSGLFVLADRITKGQLAELLLDWRGSGWSYPEICLQLHDDYGVDISAQTVRRWVTALHAEREAS
jgi:intein-encoded DNA endonuclease-like protein